MSIHLPFFHQARRRVRHAALVLLLIAACSAPVAETDPAPLATTPAARATSPAGASFIASATVVPSATPLPPTLTPTPVPSTPTQATYDSFQVRTHPDGGLYSGDQVSFEVIAPTDARVEGQSIQVTVRTQQGEHTAEAQFARYGIGARLQAVLLWAWDTQQLPPGEYPVTFRLPPDGASWTEMVTLQPRNQLPPPEPQATWVRERSECCIVYAISGTEGERDLPRLLDVIDQQAEQAVQRMGTNLEKPLTIVLLPRVLGHGGFAGQEIAVSYLDRNYMGNHPDIVLHHEIIHILDGRLGGDYRPSALVEGLAVYQSGGHFKPEPLPERAAALLPPEPGCLAWSPEPAQPSVENTPAGSPTGAEGCGVDQYVPLRRLFDNFYYEQHEVGYLQAAALIHYMVDTWGYPAYAAFYRDIQPPAPKDGKPAQSVEAALKKHFQIGLDQLETRFQDDLRRRVVTPAIAEDLRLSLAFYNTGRRYQQLLDASAYFLTAWLLDHDEMRKKDIVADYVRHPSQPENLALETMLEAADQALILGDYADSARLLEASNAVLEAYPSQGVQAFSAHPLAADYLDLVQAALASGYQPQRIRLENETARLWVRQNGPTVKLLTYIRQPSGWSLANSSH